MCKNCEHCALGCCQEEWRYGPDPTDFCSHFEINEDIHEKYNGEIEIVEIDEEDYLLTVEELEEKLMKGDK